MTISPGGIFPREIIEKIEVQSAWCKIIILCGQWCPAAGQHCSAVAYRHSGNWYSLYILARTDSDPPSQVIKEDWG